MVDTKTMKVQNKWPVAPGGSPVGLGIDTEKHRLFIGCRKPQKMIVMDADSGKVLADLPIGAGVDAVHLTTAADLQAVATGRSPSSAKLRLARSPSLDNPDAPCVVTMCVDSKTHTLYLPTAEFPTPAPNQGRPTPKPDSFMIVVAEPVKP